MKQTALFLSLLMIVFSSCKKEDIDGVYDPKKKIDRGYRRFPEGLPARDSDHGCFGRCGKLGEVSLRQVLSSRNLRSR